MPSANTSGRTNWRDSMAIETVILKVRRGPYGEFITDKQKLSVGEPCAVLSGDPSVPSGKAFYVCFQAGDARRMVSIEDLEIMVQRGDFKGDPGDPGTPGRGIKDIEVNTQSHLIFTMTDNTKIDAGFILDILEQISASEQLRIQAEKSRVSAETARAAAEASRQTAETARGAAEQARVSGENTRKSNESARAAAENTRQADEAERRLAEQARISSESARNTQWFNNIKPAAEQAIIDANTAADEANNIADILTDKLEAGEFKGEKGDKGDKGDSGVMVPTSGMFSLWLDGETGDLYAEYPDGSTPPQFEYDAESGNLYFVTDDGGA